ncbi:signal peptidase I [Massilia terrae]|uniref:Signal peptidase I n=1 Tax=Massilia terrae TaxID=1811224 RepID=A0ABT2CVI6_9BURK|nr:signal peptidase I [Massilia terrae]MCS0657098.1 signal peptidase I [Massilia terrae]
MKNWVRDNKGFLAFLLLIGVFRSAVAELNAVPSGSMRPNLLEGDVILVNRTAYNLKVPLTDVVLARLGDPARGDVVTFNSPQDGTRLVKRLIALPGDVVEMRNERLVINGKPVDLAVQGMMREPAGGGTVDAVRLDETLAGRHHSIQLLPEVDARRNFGPITVPRDQYLFLGDNRDNSKDSRYIGLVRRDLLVGRAERVVVSADYLGNWMPRPDRFGLSLR